jgi:alkanesulfonate monooxygenase SsuD/methylene tetrahydromethanopterin reductase-like flavin-dependent oxidoreductase (luciferase family)
MEIGVFDHIDTGSVPISEHYENRLRLIEAYDRAGFYAYHMAEHHFTPLGTAPSPAIFLSAISQRTERLRFGPLVYLLPFYHPLRLFEEICMLDQLSRGRFLLGIGHGISPPEAVYWGLEPATLRDRFEETFAVLMQAFAGGPLTYHGKYVHYDDVPIETAPVQKPHPPIWYGTPTSESAARAAARGFNIITNRPTIDIRGIPATYLKHLPENISPAGQLIGAARFVVVADTDEEAHDLARRSYPKFNRSLESLFRKHNLPVTGGEKPMTFNATQNDGTGIAGSPDTVLRELSEQLAGSGFNYLVVRFAISDLSLKEMTRSVELFTRHVMPALRALPTSAPYEVASASF